MSNSVRDIRHHFLITLVLLFLLSATSFAQDWIRTGTGLGVEKVRLAAADFKPSTNDANNAALLKTFNDVLWNDLDNAGIFDLVSKSFYPLQEPGQPSEVNFPAWSSPPPNTSMLAFGNLGGPNAGMPSLHIPASFDWGLSFFYGRSVYTAIEGAITPGGTGPYFAY